MRKIKIKQLLVLFSFLSLYCKPLFAENFSFLQAIKEYESQKIEEPKPEIDGRIQTLNKMGAMSPEVDIASEAFLNNIGNARVLEIGAAYGNILIKGIEKGVIKYYVNDLEKQHLLIAANKVGKLFSESALSEKIEFCSGDYPTKCVFEDNFFDKILVARVLHFFNPEQLDKTIKDLYRILKPGGKVYIVAITPYVKRYASFIDQYEANIVKGVEYPGYVKSLAGYADPNVTSRREMEKITKGEFMFLDSKILQKLFSKRGFNIIEAREVPLKYYSPIWQLDGRENTILIAQKPF